MPGLLARAGKKVSHIEKKRRDRNSTIALITCIRLADSAPSHAKGVDDVQSGSLRKRLARPISGLKSQRELENGGVSDTHLLIPGGSPYDSSNDTFPSENPAIFSVGQAGPKQQSIFFCRKRRATYWLFADDHLLIGYIHEQAVPCLY